MDKREKIVIIGGGFAGLKLVQKLDKKKYDIVLVDRNNYHSFPPLFYQIASSSIDPNSICFPLRREMQKSSAKGTRFHMGEVKTIDFAARQVVTQYESLPFDRLIIAAGCTNNFFGNPDLVKYVYTIKSATEAMRLRNQILERLEYACLTHDMEKRRKLLSFVVVGGGPSGVEVAGALGEMKRDIIPREYTSLDPNDVKIILLEGGDRLLPTMSKHASIKAKEYLQRLMVDVRLGALMQDYKDSVITLGNGQTLYSETVVWTAGITGVAFDIVGADIAKAPGGRIPVDDCNRILGVDNAYAVGDIAYLPCDIFPKGYPQLAQVAIQQARHLAEQINKDDFSKAFKYNDRGSMATVGKNLAVADLPRAQFGGFWAWLIWMFIHLISILGMRNKVSVLINWVWAYFTNNTGLRALFEAVRYPIRRRWGES